MNDSINRLKMLTEKLPAHAVDIQRLLEYSNSDRSAALGKIRMITESVVRDLCETTRTSWGSKPPMLGNMLGPLRSKGIIPRDHSLHVDTILAYANSAIHGNPTGASHIDICLLAFAEFLEWFVSNPHGDPEYMVDIKRLGLGRLITLEDIQNGIYVLTEEDRNRRQQDLSRVLQDENASAYPVDSVFQLTSSSTMARDNLLKVKVNKQAPGPTNLLSRPIDLNYAYVAPLQLLTGLITSFDDNWPPLIKAYQSLAEEKEGTLYAFHWFMEICWLSWGPSVDTSYLASDPNSHFFLAQVSLGDEANSLPLIVEREMWEEQFGNLRRSRICGWPLMLKKLDVVNPMEDMYFEDLVKHPEYSDLFCDNIALYYSNRSGFCSLSGPNKPFYNTAYLWLIIEQVSPDIMCGNRCSNGYSVEPLSPGSVLPFTEHANLASEDAFEFMLKCLVRKTVQYILLCETKPIREDEGYYRYATALFDKMVVNALNVEIESLSKSDRKIIERRFVIPAREDRSTSKDVIKFVEKLNATIRGACVKEPCG